MGAGLKPNDPGTGEAMGTFPNASAEQSARQHQPHVDGAQHALLEPNESSAVACACPDPSDTDARAKNGVDRLVDKAVAGLCEALSEAERDEFHRSSELRVLLVRRLRTALADTAPSPVDASHHGHTRQCTKLEAESTCSSGAAMPAAIVAAAEELLCCLTKAAHPEWAEPEAARAVSLLQPLCAAIASASRPSPTVEDPVVVWEEQPANPPRSHPARIKKGDWVVQLPQDKADCSCMQPVGKVLQFQKQRGVHCAWGPAAERSWVDRNSIVLSTRPEHWSALSSRAEAVAMAKKETRSVMSSSQTQQVDTASSFGKQLESMIVRIRDAGALFNMHLLPRTAAILAELNQLTVDARQALVPDPDFQDLNDSLTCYVTHDTSTEDVLGFGLQLKCSHGRITTLESPCEMLSHSAWHECGIRTSTYRSELNAWLPLYISGRHWERAAPMFRQHLSKLAISAAPAEQGLDPILVLLPRLMNDMVVSTMKDGICSQHKLRGFFQIHRLFLQHVITDSRARQQVNALIGRFAAGQEALPAMQHKRHCPNLGEWLMLLTVSANWKWSDVAAAYCAESARRNVRWYLRQRPELARADLQHGKRAQLVFESTRVSRGLLCFTLHFLDIIERTKRSVRLGAVDGSDATLPTLLHVARCYDRRLGNPQPGTAADLQKAWREIVAIESWAEYYARIRLPCPSLSDLEVELHAAVAQSRIAGYHEENAHNKGTGTGTGKGTGRGKGKGKGKGKGQGRSW